MQTAGNAFSFVILWENYASWVKANSMDMPKEEGAEKSEASEKTDDKDVAKLFAQGLFAMWAMVYTSGEQREIVTP